MEIESQNSWFSLIKFILGTVVLGILGHCGNQKIQETKLEMEALKQEDNYIRSFMTEYSTKGTKQQLEYVSALFHLSFSESRQKRFKNLLNHLQEKDKKTSQLKIEKDSTSFRYKADLDKKTDLIIELQAKTDSLTELKKSVQSDRVKQQELELQIENETKRVSDLMNEAQVFQDSISSLALQTHALELKLDNPDSKPLEIPSIKLPGLEGKRLYDLRKGQQVTIEELGITIHAQKVNNILGRAYLWVNTKTKHNPAFSLKPGQFGIFSHQGKSYKLKLKRTHNEDGIVGHSYAEFEISEDNR